MSEPDGIEPRHRIGRRRRAIATAVGVLAAVVAAIGPAFALTHRAGSADSDRNAAGSGSAVPTVTTAPSAAASAVAKPPGAAIALRYRPGWLPDGARETQRTHHPATSEIYRVWQLPAGSRLQVVLHVAEGAVLNESGEPVDINGVEGRVSPNRHAVRWNHRDGHHITVSVSAPDSPASGDFRDLALRIARSVAPHQSTMAPPVAFGWLPAGYALNTQHVSGQSAQRWEAHANASATPTDTRAVNGPFVILQHGTCAVTCEVDTGAVPVTVRGRAGHYVPSSQRGPFVQVDLGGGEVLFVFDPVRRVGRDHLIRIADALSLDPSPDLAWLGG